MTPKKAFVIWMTLKIHFAKESFDAIKYNHINSKSLEKIYDRYKDKFFFEKLCKKSNLVNFYLANIIERDIEYPIDLLDDVADSTYVEWSRRNESLTYVISNDLLKLEDGFIDAFKSFDGQHPDFLRRVRQKDVCLETLIALDTELKFFPVWSNKIRESIIWPRLRLKCDKYRPFLKYDKKKIKKQINDFLKCELNTISAASAA
jgi:hypothetical protein